MCRSFSYFASFYLFNNPALSLLLPIFYIRKPRSPNDLTFLQAQR